ncbi:MAG: shikimate kinase [Clostridia bacterium]|nr:shikimate kinase [Clostridia bacterium]
MNNIILIGMPGSGKTTVTDLCTKKVWDTDAYIENLYGNISDIFANFGEEHFRKLETEAIRQICKEDDCFIATGGGAVLREENVRLFKQSGKIVYLRTNLDTLLKRLDGDTTRPLLIGNTKERLTKLYNERTPIYESVADIIIDTDGLTPLKVLEKIYRQK